MNIFSQPGVPMEIALNKESKRKTPVAIAFRAGERTFGDDAIAAGIKWVPNSNKFQHTDRIFDSINNQILD